MHGSTSDITSTARRKRVTRHPTCQTATVKNFLIRVAVNGVALWVAALVIPGIDLAENESTFSTKVLTIFLVALIFGLLNAVIKPIAMLLSLPFIVLTLGLFIFLVNAFMLQVTEWVSDWLDLSFTIDEFFWDAVFGAVIITLVSWLLNVILPEDD